MGQSKIEIKIGIVEFTGEGEQEWLGQQLDKIIEKLPELLKIELASPQASIGPSSESRNTESNPSTGLPSNLSSYLREKNATSNQVNKFLVTAAFLQLGGKTRMSTTDVSNLLKSSNQSRLANASDALNKNVGKGFCEKDGGQFFVTQEGLDFVAEMK